jgi:hypothetical protein
LIEEGGAPLGVGAAEQLARLLPRQVEPMQGSTDGLAAAQTTEPIPHETDQPPQRPARFRIGSG